MYSAWVGKQVEYHILCPNAHSFILFVDYGIFSDESYRDIYACHD